MSSEDNKKVIRRLERILNAGALDEVDEIFTPDYMRHDPNPLLKDAGIEKSRHSLQY